MLHLDDAVGAKMSALLGRGLPRDYLDIAAALAHFPRARLLELAFQRDPGLRVDDVALAMRRLDRLPDEPFGQYGLRPRELTALRARFSDWPRGSDLDDQARDAHTRAHTQRDEPARER